MNLSKIANRVTRRINPNLSATLYKSQGYKVNDDRDKVPAYSDPIPLQVNKQDISQMDLQHLDNLNIQGRFASFFTDYRLQGVDRSTGRGGDVLKVGNEFWLIVSTRGWGDDGTNQDSSPETWTRAIGCLQKTSPIT